MSNPELPQNFYFIECEETSLAYLMHGEKGLIEEALKMLNNMRGAKPKYTAHLQTGILPNHKTIHLVNPEHFFSQKFHNLYN